MINVEQLRNAIRNANFEWRLHAIRRLVERKINQGEVLSVLLNGQIVEVNSDDFPFPSVLFYGTMSDGRPLHCLASYDENANRSYIITAYIPDTQHFETDWKTRRRK